MKEYKLILISDNTDKPCIRYIKKGERHWNTLYLEETNTDTIIDKVLESLKSE